MRLHTYLDDGSLIEKLQGIEGVASVVPLTQIEELKETDSDLLVISDLKIEPSDLPEIRQKYQKGKILYLISNSEDGTKYKRLVCQTNQIDFIMPFHAENSIIQKVEQMYFGRVPKETEIIGFFSSLPQQGLTSSIISIAQQMGIQTTAKIGVIGLNCFSSGSYEILDYKGKTFDELWGLMQSKHLTPEDLYDKAHMLGENVYYIAGNRVIKKTYFYEQEGVCHLLLQAKKAFDIVLLDIGANIDNAVAAQGLYSSNAHILLMTQMWNHINAFQEQYDQILHPHFDIEKKNILLLVNKSQDLPGLVEPKEIIEELKMRRWGEIPYERDFYLRIQQKASEGHVSKLYTDTISRLARALIDMYGLPIKEEASKRRSSLLGKVFSLGVK